MSKALKDYNSIDWKNIFYYDETSPTFLRYISKTKSGKKNAGDQAGGKSHGYYVVSYNGSKWLAHRVVWIIKNGYLSNDLVIDHLDGNQSNNNIKNLRKTTQKYNSRNALRMADNKLGKTGVYFTTVKNKSRVGLYTYCSASWYEDRDGKTRKVIKHFSVHKMGLLPAHAAAIKFREDKIIELNANGYGYTDLHGKLKTQEHSEHSGN